MSVQGIPGTSAMGDISARDAMMGDAATDAANIIGAIGKTASGVIDSYGKTQSNAYSDVIQTGGLTVGAWIGLIVAGAIVYKLIGRK